MSFVIHKPNLKIALGNNSCYSIGCGDVITSSVDDKLALIRLAVVRLPLVTVMTIIISQLLLIVYRRHQSLKSTTALHFVGSIQDIFTMLL